MKEFKACKGCPSPAKCKKMGKCMKKMDKYEKGGMVKIKGKNC
jgi:hypothetical protein